MGVVVTVNSGNAFANLDILQISKFSKIGIDLLMSDSTNATVKELTPSESTVGPVLEDTFFPYRFLLLTYFYSFFPDMNLTRIWRQYFVPAGIFMFDLWQICVQIKIIIVSIPLSFQPGFPT